MHPCKNCETKVNQPMSMDQKNTEEKQIFAVMYFSRKWALVGWFLVKPSQLVPRFGEVQAGVKWQTRVNRMV